MLELKNITFTPPKGENPLLHDITLQLPKKHFAAIIGPSGCGKSTLLKVIAGIHEAEEGEVIWDGQTLDGEQDFDPWELGYVPQFSIAFERLTVWDNLWATLSLRLRLGRRERRQRLETLADHCGLTELLDKPVRVLSGGQRRRLGLALELVTQPSVLLCDEVTSGLDPRSEKDISDQLRSLADDPKRLVLCVTHSLAELAAFDSVIVLHEGRLIFHGRPKHLTHYFGVTHPEEVYPLLSRRSAEGWHKSWGKHGMAYLVDLLAEGPPNKNQPSALLKHASDHDAHKFTSASSDAKETQRMSEDLSPSEEAQDRAPQKAAKLQSEQLSEEAPQGPSMLPGFLAQTWSLFGRRLQLFFRDPSQIVLQAALIFGFPMLVVIFAWQGLPGIQHLTMGGESNPLEQAQEALDLIGPRTEAGTLVSGLILFQLILLALMGSNNGAREIAGERVIFEKEKLGGLRPGAYLCSKIIFLLGLIAVQALWMGFFVQWICRFPGAVDLQWTVLFLQTAAVTFVALAISAYAKSADQASLLSVYLVGFQLPLSGALLAPPEILGQIVRPFISTYWSWSGFLQTMRDTDHYDVALQVAQTALSPLALCLWLLLCHVGVSLFFAYAGIRRSESNL